MSNPEALLLRWIKRARESSFAHYTAEARYARLHYLIGIPAAIFSAIVGTSVFASLETTVDIRIKIALGAISIITAILTGIQTFLRYSERAERHRKTAIDYGSVRREIEQHLVYPETVSDDSVTTIRKRLDGIADIAPNVTQRIWHISERAASATDYFLSDSPAPPTPVRAPRPSSERGEPTDIPSEGPRPPS